MDTNSVKKIKINNYSGFIVNIEGFLFPYSNQGYISKGLLSEDIITEQSFVDDLRNKGYTKFMSYIKDENEKETNLINVCNYINQGFRSITFRRYIHYSVVVENFYYHISIQISGKEIKRFYPLTKELKVIDNDIITFITHADNTDGMYGKFGATADKLFGPRYKTESWYRTEDERASEEYRKHISEIEKIFLTKEFRDVEVIGTENEFVKNGKIERLELDLRNPDMAVYEKMRAIDNCIEIEWEE